MPGIYDIIGYIGTFFVILSFAMTSVVKLRIFNMVGSILSTIYSITIGAVPTIIMNIVLLILNLYQLIRMNRTTVTYQIVKVGYDDNFVSFFVDKYAEDMKKYFPAFDPKSPSSFVVLPCIDTTPVGLMAGDLEYGVLTLKADYTTPAYRDCSVGKAIYADLKKEGIQTVVFKDAPETHLDYLNKMGFVAKNGIYEKTV